MYNKLLLFSLCCALFLSGISFGEDVSLQPPVIVLTNAHSAKRKGYKKQVVEFYCQKSLSENILQGQLSYVTNDVDFNSKDSLFVRALCSAR